MTPYPHWAQLEPSSCRECGIDRRAHASQWAEHYGWHQWRQPTQRQILARMRRRRTRSADIRWFPNDYRTGYRKWRTGL